jgi:hypothetical protein
MVAARSLIKIEFEEARQGDIIPAVISSDRARVWPGWESRKSFAEGPSELVDHVQAKAAPAAHSG